MALEAALILPKLITHLEGFKIKNGNNLFKSMLTILGTVAGMARELTVERIREGMAKVKNVWHEVRPRQIPASFKKYYPMRKNRDITVTDFA